MLRDTSSGNVRTQSMLGTGVGPRVLVLSHELAMSVFVLIWQVGSVKREAQRDPPYFRQLRVGAEQVTVTNSNPIDLVN